MILESTAGLFQNVLNGTASNIDHAICAAVYLYGKILQKRPRPAYEAVAAVTAAHHSALRSYASMRPELSELFNGTGRGICGSGKTIRAPWPGGLHCGRARFLQDFPDFTFKKLEQHPDDSPGEKMLRLRMLFSCLLDADYTVSADIPPQTGGALNAAELLQRLYEHMANLRRQSSANQALNRLRDQVFRQCGAAGELSPRRFHPDSAYRRRKDLLSAALCAAALRRAQQTARHFGPPVSYADRAESERVQQTDPPYPV